MAEPTIHAATAVNAFAQSLGPAQAEQTLTAADLIENPDLFAQYAADLFRDVFHLLTAAGLAIGEICGWGLDQYIEQTGQAPASDSDRTIAARVLADLVASPFLTFVHDDPAGLLRHALTLVEQHTVDRAERESA